MTRNLLKKDGVNVGDMHMKMLTSLNWIFWIYRTGEEDTPAESETVVLKELILELNECISTIIGMWKGLEKNHKKTIHSGIERLQEAQAKFVELGSDL